MRTTISVFIVFWAVFNGVILAQPAINGSWTSYYGGNFYMCADEFGEVNGVYAELGYIRGTLSGTSLVGQWFQTGLNVADLNGRCCTPNRGSFTFSMATNSFSGSYLFEDTAKGGESWSGTKKSSVTPLDQQCWTPIETLTTSLQGRWESDSFTNTWDQCIDSNGVWTASYEYGTARTRGYIFGKCFYNGQFCHGDWFEPGRINGGYMVRLLSNSQMVGSWWQFNASDITSTTYTRYATNPLYHSGEIRRRIGEATGCSRNADLFFSGSSTTPLFLGGSAPELEPGAIIGIVVGVVGAAFIAGIVLLCVFCRGRCTGGGGGRYHTTNFHTHRTRRHGFGFTHRRYGGGYA